MTESANKLAALLNPQAVALYGASENSMWSHAIFNSSLSYGRKLRMYAINRRGASAHGLPGYSNCSEIPEPIDAAYIFVPIEGVLDAVKDVAAAGAKAAVVLTSGFGEAGPQGLALQDELVRCAQEQGVVLMGPNSLGLANLYGESALTVIPRPAGLVPGRVALVSQSGAICSEILEYAAQSGVGIGFFAATGNEASTDLASFIEGLVDDPNTDVIAVFAETIRDGKRFRKAARVAALRGKAIVILKVGSSEVSAAVAQAHTGSLVGDDKVFDAVCRQEAVIRVKSIEDLVTTAALIAHTGRLDRPGAAVVSISGGGCGLFGDAAEEAQLALPAFSEQTVAALRAVLPDYASTLNPFDITGAAVREPELFQKCLEIIDADPNVGLTFCIYSLPADEMRVAMTQQQLQPIGAALQKMGRRGIALNAAVRPVNGVMRKAMQAAGIPAVAGGIDAAVRAAGKLAWWSQAVGQQRTAPSVAEAPAAATQNQLQGEQQALQHLQSFGVPVIPQKLVTSAEEAALAAREIGGALAFKIASPDIAHKTEVGGVRLKIEGEQQARDVFSEIMASVRSKAANARIEGIVVSPMRAPAVELLVGVSRDPQWGLVLVVGLGGVWVEVLRDSALLPLPATAVQVEAALRGLRAAKLLDGYRGAAKVNIEKLASVIVNITSAAQALGDDLAAFEINPLRVDGEQIEALDALAIWNKE